MGTLGLKLLLTPLLIAVATLAGRRWGPGVSGWLAGFPLTSGPVSVFLALEQGRPFAAEAALGTLLGLTSMAAFCLVYGRTALRAGWVASSTAGLATFFAGTLVLSKVSLSLLPAFGLVCAALGAITLAIPTRLPLARVVGAQRWDLALRMAAATGVVLLLTAVASVLGPRLSGLLSPFPMFALVLAVFTHRSHGAVAATRVLRGVVIGSFAFAAFFLVVGALLDRLGIGATYVVATGTALTVNAASLYIGRRAL